MNCCFLKKIITWVLLFGASSFPLGAMLPRSMTVSHNSSLGQHKTGPSRLQRLASWFEAYLGRETQSKKQGQLQAQHRVSSSTQVSGASKNQ